MARLFDLIARLRSGGSPGRQRMVHRLLYELIYSLPTVARDGFFNGGFDPPPEGCLTVPALASAPCQAAFYDFALRAHPGAGLPAPPSLLDIGCGPGGGLLYAAAAFPGAQLAGLDQSAMAVRAARRRLREILPRPELVQGRADRLPFADGRFARVVSIGTLSYVAPAPLLAEAARVLAPGGLLSVTGGSTDTPLGWTRSRLDRAALAVGLEPQRFTTITEPCFAALQRDAPRHAALVARLPWFLRDYAREWAVLPGSARHAMYRDGRKQEFAAVFAKPA
jgi:SAM-dependent methyltransferase